MKDPDQGRKSIFDEERGEMGREADEFTVDLFAEMTMKHNSVKGEIGWHGVVMKWTVSCS